MLKLGSYQRFGAITILAVFMAGWVLVTCHQLLSHHTHTGLPECSATYDPHTTHLHDETYALEHCSLCAFLLSTPELLSITAAIVAQGTDPGLRDTFHCTPFCSGTFYDTTCLRGPPVL